MNTERKNRMVVLSALVCFILLVALMTLLTPKAEHDLLNRPSSYYSDKTGAKALLLVLREFLPTTIQWRKPFAVFKGHQQIPSNIDTLIVASPGRPLDPNEAEALLQWIENGGQLILAINHDWSISDQPFREQTSWLRKRRKTVFDNQGAHQNNRVQDGVLKRLNIRMKQEETEDFRKSEWLTLDNETPVYEIKLKHQSEWQGDVEPLVVNELNETQVAIHSLGSGRILITGSDSIIMNEAMEASDNPVWWTRICHQWGMGRVAFDEYHHGFAEKQGILTLSTQFLKTPWGWGTLQVMITGLLFILLYKKRMGRICAHWIAHTLALDLSKGNLKTGWREWIEMQAAQTQSTELQQQWQRFLKLLNQLESSKNTEESSLKQLSQTAATIQTFYHHEH